ncbi:MAG: hypothetical protein ACJA14_002890 [Ilumatobacter sp.]
MLTIAAFHDIHQTRARWLARTGASDSGSPNKEINTMNKRIRTSLLTAAIAGGTILGVTQVGGVANAQVDDAPAPAETTADDDTTDKAARRAAHQEARQANRDEIASLLGLDSEALREQLQGGSTLADVAQAQGVETSEIVDLLVGQKTERIAAAVEAGRITEEEAAAKSAEFEERVQTRVEEGRPERGEGERGERGPRGEGERGEGERGEGGPRGDRGPRGGGDRTAEAPTEG